MKSKFKKPLLCSMLLVVMMAVSYYLFGQEASNLVKGQEKLKPEVTSELVEILPNGGIEMRVMEKYDEETTKWLIEKREDLQLLIAQQTGLKDEDVLVSVAHNSQGDTKNQEIACSVVLNTASTFDDQLIQNVVNGIINVFEQDKVSATISKENIVIANNNSDILH